MFDFLTNGFKELCEGLATVEEKIGFKKFKNYIIFGLLIAAIINIEPIARRTIEFVTEIAEDLHLEKMKLRDEYMTDLNPILVELRSELNADRVLYFEYHNSEQNLDKMPFKFFDLMSYDIKYSVVGTLPVSSYKDINASQFQSAYNELKKGRVLHCKGAYDHEFRQKYQGVFELFNQIDLSKQHILVSVPGIKRPIGFIVLEWMEDSIQIDKNKAIECINDCLPRINALVVSAKK